MGGFATAMGLFIVAVAAGAVPADPGTIHAPSWVLHCAGGMFTLVGVWIATAGTPVGNGLNVVTGPVVLVGLLSILHWVAFGPGVRQCSGGVSIPFLSARGPVGDLGCRVGFGYGALLFDGILIGTLLSNWAERQLRGTLRSLATGIGNALIVIPLLPFIVLLAGFSLVKALWIKVRGTG